MCQCNATDTPKVPEDRDRGEKQNQHIYKEQLSRKHDTGGGGIGHTHTRSKHDYHEKLDKILKEIISQDSNVVPHRSTN